MITVIVVTASAFALQCMRWARQRTRDQINMAPAPLVEKKYASMRREMRGSLRDRN